MENRNKISSILIARDEEQNIQRCLQSQLRCINEIVVLVDENSSDKTYDIVKSFPGVKCEVVRWMGYAQTKQYAVSLTTNDWVFWIDADEVITDELSQELNELKVTDNKFAAYDVPRLANFLGRWIKHSGWYPGRVTRLFNKKLALFNQKDVHENLIIDGSTGNLSSNLLHYTDPTIRHYFQKFNNYTSLAAEELIKQNKKLSISDIVIRPSFIFIKMYIIKMGFLDGIQGFMLAVFSSVYVFTKYCKFWEMKYKDKNKGTME